MILKFLLKVQFKILAYRHDFLFISKYTGAWKDIFTYRNTHSVKYKESKCSTQKKMLNIMT